MKTTWYLAKRKTFGGHKRNLFLCIEDGYFAYSTTAQNALEFESNKAALEYKKEHKIKYVMPHDIQYNN